MIPFKTTTNAESDWFRIRASGDYAVMIENANFDGATLTIKQGFKETGLDENVTECAQETELVITSAKAPFIVTLAMNTFVKFVVTGAGASTNVSVRLLR